ncbi:MAG: hypothetical protein K2N87_15350 [Eubacterium sp.]|nr:hypothetical protein [Eubacterium sp.]
MNFKSLTELTQDHQYEELKVIGKDAFMGGKQVHVIAMVRKEDETTLFIMSKAQGEMQKQEEPPKPNRQLLKDYVQNDFASVSKLEMDGRTFRSRSAQSGRLQACDLDSLLILAKFMEAGWSLPQGHELLETDWEQIEVMRCIFHPTRKKLPDWDNADVKVTWSAQLKQHFIEMPVTLELEDTKEDGTYERELSFMVSQDDGTKKEAVCYINRIRLVDIWAEEEARYEDPEYRRQVLEHVTEEEWEQLRQSSAKALENVCPRGMYFLVIEYECTLDLSLQFYLSDFLQAVPTFTEGEGESMLFGVQTGQERQGSHGMLLKEALIQQPISGEVTELSVELFAAGEYIPEEEEKVEWLN